MGSPVKLLLLATIPGYGEDEAALHYFLRKDRAHGEWFKMSDMVLDIVEAAIKEGKNGVADLMMKAYIDKPQQIA